MHDGIPERTGSHFLGHDSGHAHHNLSSRYLEIEKCFKFI
jgi:hypothetical protein